MPALASAGVQYDLADIIADVIVEVGRLPENPTCEVDKVTGKYTLSGHVSLAACAVREAVLQKKKQ